MTDKDDLLSKASKLKETAAEYTAKLDEAKTRRAIIKDKLDELGTKLSAVTGSMDFSSLTNALEVASAAAKSAAEALSEALDGLDLDLDDF